MAGNRSLTQYEAASRKRLGVSAVIILGVLPALIALGAFVLGQKWYLPLSLAMLVLIMAPFFMMFERRRPKAREIVLIAMMSAVTVVSHLFFHVVIPIQIGTALVIISGISLGPEAGFLIGALSRFIVNFYLGQGVWTPWQMFCWGILGFLAGLCFNKGSLDQVNSRSFKAVMGPVLSVVFAELAAYALYLVAPGNDESFFGWRMYAFGAAGLLLGVLVQRKRLPLDAVTLTAFTFLTTFVIYGGIMNFASLVTSMNIPGSGGFTREALRAMYISGIPYDLLHAGTASLCVFFLGDPIVKKLERIKIKYGIYR